MIFFFKIILAIWGPLDFFHFYENDINILIGVAMNLYLAFGSVSSSNSQVYEQDLSFWFRVPCFTLSVGCVVFSVLVVSL